VCAAQPAESLLPLLTAPAGPLTPLALAGKVRARHAAPARRHTPRQHITFAAETPVFA
jgi:hypothetical protein